MPVIYIIYSSKFFQSCFYTKQSQSWNATQIIEPHNLLINIVTTPTQHQLNSKVVFDMKMTHHLTTTTTPPPPYKFNVINISAVPDPILTKYQKKACGINNQNSNNDRNDNKKTTKTTPTTNLSYKWPNFDQTLKLGFCDHNNNNNFFWVVTILNLI